MKPPKAMANYMRTFGWLLVVLGLVVAAVVHVLFGFGLFAFGVLAVRQPRREECDR